VRLSELSGKEIVDVKRAERLGVLGQTDLEINESGQITALIIPSVKWFGLKRNGNEVRVPWKHIKKIGTDMIIIDIPEIQAGLEQELVQNIKFPD
jgi:YlmC/YmxH family sporulation protein